MTGLARDPKEESRREHAARRRAGVARPGERPVESIETIDGLRAQGRYVILTPEQ